MASADAATGAGAANIELEIVSIGAGETVTVTSEGVNDASAGSARLTTTVSQPGLDPVSVNTIVVDGVLYLGGLPDQPAGSWLRVPVDQGQQFGVDGSSADPSQTLQLLRGVNDDVAEVGTQQRRGLAVTRYAGTIDVADALAAMPPAQAELIGPIYAESGITAIPFELSVDDRGRPTELVQTLALTIEGEAIMVESTVEFFDWGTEVDITAPDPAQVVDAVGAPAPTA